MASTPVRSSSAGYTREDVLRLLHDSTIETEVESSSLGSEDSVYDLYDPEDNVACGDDDSDGFSSPPAAPRY